MSTSITIRVQKTQSADKTSHAWNATTGAVSIGTSDGTVTRQINGVAAGTNDTDAVNVAQLKKLEGMKANVDATNIQGENLTKWQTALTGTVTSGNTGLMTGGAVYNEVRPTTDGTYVKSTSTTAANLSALDTQVNTNTGDITTNKTDIKNLKDLSNLTDAGKSVSKEAAKGSVKVVNGKNTIVTEGTEGDAKTYAVNVDNSTIKGAVQGDLDKKANVDATNIQGENLTKWQAALGTGAVTSGNTGLMTGGAVYNEVRPTKDGTYVKSTNTTAANLTALDTQVTTNTSDIAKNKTDIANNKTAIDNITKNVSDLSGNAVQYDADFNKQKVTLKGEGGTTIANVKDGALSDKSTDAVNGKQLFNEQQAREAADKAINDKIGTLNQNGKYILKDSSISSNLSTLDNKVKENADHIAQNTNDIKNLKDSSSTISKEIEIKAGKDLDNITDKGKQVIKDTMKADMDKKANVDASNIETSKWADKLGTGKVVEGDKNLINGDTVHNAIHEAEGRNPVQSDGQTITIGSKDTATKIDVSGTGKDGQSTGRIITGVVTDVDDPNSAANVGYVNGLTAANTQQIYRDMNNAYSRLDTNINRAAAGSNALAALHPLDFDPADKASFAVGYGHYRNANAAAVGAFYQPNANTMVNMGISLGNGDPGFNAGVSFKIGKGSAYNGVSKAEMAQTIHDQATEISAIKADDAAKDKRIDALEKENQEMKKQIQEILARLNG
ncbi:YadA-like family protein [Megasphaera elsdenii]|uniref:YadA-like family protein n=1 Tax=Megasphaera elsdenii TaxID=907 RepID=UPI0039F46200